MRFQLPAITEPAFRNMAVCGHFDDATDPLTPAQKRLLSAKRTFDARFTSDGKVGFFRLREPRIQAGKLHLHVDFAVAAAFAKPKDKVATSRGAIEEMLSLFIGREISVAAYGSFSLPSPDARLRSRPITAFNRTYDVDGVGLTVTGVSMKVPALGLAEVSWAEDDQETKISLALARTRDIVDAGYLRRTYERFVSAARFVIQPPEEDTYEPFERENEHFTES